MRGSKYFGLFINKKLGVTYHVVIVTVSFAKTGVYNITIQIFVLS